MQDNHKPTQEELDKAEKELTAMYQAEIAKLDRIEEVLGKERYDELIDKISPDMVQGHMFKEFQDHPQLNVLFSLGEMAVVLVEHVVFTGMIVGYLFGRWDERENHGLESMLGDIDLDI